MTEEEQEELRTITHELNNVLAVVISNLELLQMKRVPGIDHIIKRTLDGTVRGKDVVEKLRTVRKKAASSR